mmetsp:Transcript_25259/g.59549  ORF Transcript_25259/g.59549 Transcript_25259/m.59549 type:complete len:172 (+) Transcript_25259:225-740(+)
MIMEIEESKAGESDCHIPETSRTENPNEVPMPSSVTKADDDENDEDSDSDDAITCPLFMTGLPKNFATNPQLAAIASLLDDDDDDNNNNNDVDNDDGNVDSITKNEGSPNHDRDTATIERGRNSVCRSTRTHNRRRQQRAAPYSHHKKQTKKKSKGGSVGEITLFMNMWKP